MMMLDMRIDLLNEDARCSLSDDVAAKWLLLLWGCGGGRHLDGLYLVHEASQLCSSHRPITWMAHRLDGYDNQEGGRCSLILSYAYGVMVLV